jgi:hypothetical protein
MRWIKRSAAMIDAEAPDDAAHFILGALHGGTGRP